MASQPIFSVPDDASSMGASQSIPPMSDEANSMEADSPQTEPTQGENSTEDKIPKVGMKFCSEEEAYNFYNAYAGDKGFSIRRSSSHNVKNSSTIKNRTFCCSRAGVRRPEKKEESSNYSRPETQLASVENAKAVGISNKATFDLLAKEAGGVENLGFTREDMKNKLYSKRSLQTNHGDTGGVLEYLEKKTAEDGKFFYSIQVDEDDLITNIFWTDSKMVADYKVFGDVVCFDTTYRKLNDGRPFGLLVGVNNHKRTTIFGAALLYDETAESFVWLFNTFLTAMSGKKPKTILTDEDAAMAKAIKIVLPETHHVTPRC